MPSYTDRAKREGVEGDVGLEATVRGDGQLTDVRVVKSLDAKFGLDRQALNAVKNWQFAPALQDGKPMWTRILLDLRFSLTSPTAASVVRPLETVADAFGAGVYRPPPPGTKPDNLVWPKVKYQPAIEYTAGAMNARISGTVVLEAVLRTDGTIGEIRIVKSLDPYYGLDANVLSTLRRWTFEPAKVDGKPVPMVIQIELEFRWHGHPLSARVSPVLSSD